MTECRTSKPSRSSKILRQIKQHLNKNSKSCDNGRVDPSFQGLPVPAPPPATFAATNVHASFPTPTPPRSQTWCTPNQHDQEASGSNHTSKQNSEYFDALDTSEYLNQHQIPNYSAELLVRQGNHQPGLAEELACSFQDIRVSTSSTSHDQTYYPNPFAFETNLVSASYCNPVNEHYSNEHLFLDSDDATATSTQQSYGHGAMDQSLFQGFDDATATSTQQSYGHETMNPSWYLTPDDATATSAQQSYGHGIMNKSLFQDFDDATTTTAQQQYEYGHGHGHGHGSMSMATGYTIDSGFCSTMDTGASSSSPSQSPYIRQPVVVERPTSFCTIYTDLRRIIRGERTPEGSGRRGRSFRVLSNIVCIALRLKGRMASRSKRQEPADKEIREPLCQLREQCTKMKKRKWGGASTASSTEHKYTRITKRKGKCGEKWNVEVRVSMVHNSKVWVGTFGSKKEAALAADAGLFHCTAKSKEYNFSEFTQDLGPSQYQKVYALCESGHKQEAQDLVKSLAKGHVAKFGSP